VLIVEDEADSRIMLATILTMQGYETVMATNGAEALTIARQQTPCLILLDLMMPIMDGEQFREAQLADATLRDVPVIVLTARYDGERTAQRLHTASCIVKPLNVSQLVNEVAAHCLRDVSHV
jgi:DNA-binding response OmpR family regulator